MIACSHCGLPAGDDLLRFGDADTLLCDECYAAELDELEGRAELRERRQEKC